MCVVSFDANGGIVEKTSETFPSGEPLGRLPIPTRDGYVFEGWYDSPIPGVGYGADSRYDDYGYAAGLYGCYWSSVPYESNSGCARYLRVYSGIHYTDFSNQGHGFSVRPVQGLAE